MTREGLEHAFEVDEELCVVAFLSKGDVREVGENLEIWRELEAVRDAACDVFVPFGNGTACVITRSKSPSVGAPLRGRRAALWDQEKSGFRPAAFATWLRARRHARAEPWSLLAIVSVTLRVDLLLLDGHLTPTAAAEVVCKRLHGQHLDVDAWLCTGDTDLFFILRADDVHEVGRAVDAIRDLRLGDVFTEAADTGPFTSCLSETFTLRADEVTAQILSGEVPEDLPGNGEADTFVRSRRVFDTTRTLIGTPVTTICELLRCCADVSRELIEGDVAPALRDARPLDRVTRFVRHALVGANAPLRLKLAEVFRAGPLPVPAFVALRVRPGREAVLRQFVSEVRAEVFAALELPSSSLLPPVETPSIFGGHDLIALDGVARGGFGTIVAFLIVLQHLAYVDPLTAPRFAHVLGGTHTAIGFYATPPSQSPPHELGRFSDADRGDALQSLEHPDRAPLRAVHRRLSTVAHTRWEHLSLPAVERADAAARMLPRHVVEAIGRLVDVYNAALRTPTSAFSVLDLRPSFLTLIRFIESARVVEDEHGRPTTIHWHPIPSVHGGGGRAVELPLSSTLTNIVRVIHLLDHALRQRIPGRAADLAGGRAIELISGRTRWLAGLATLVPALQELHTPEPFQFRYTGVGVVELTASAIEVLPRGFALVQVDPRMLDEPELMVLLLQELGHVALRAPRHAEVVREVEERIITRLGADSRDPTESDHRARRAVFKLLSEAYCDMSLLFLGFEGNFDRYIHFMLCRLPRLAPTLTTADREGILERLCLVSALLDRHAPDATDTPTSADLDAVHQKQEAKHADDPYAVERRVLQRFTTRVGSIFSSASEGRDLWEVQRQLIGEGLASREFRHRVLHSVRDAMEIVVPSVLSRLVIGRRSITNWFDAISRRGWDRPPSHTQPPPTPKRPILARNLQRAYLAHRDWPGIRHLTPDEQRTVLEGPSFPLVVPSDIEVWLTDARDALCRHDVTAAERVALLHSLWSASLAFRGHMIAREDAAQRSGRTPDATPAGRRGIDRAVFVRLFTLRRREELR